MGKLHLYRFFFLFFLVCFPGLKPGTVVITKQSVDATFLPRFEQVILGKPVVRSTELDSELADELLLYSKDFGDFETVVANTMCTMDFYEGKTVKKIKLYQQPMT